ncbi:uncharacterized protein LOC125055359 isoform X1 [Pieris napi]|uniref:uncharacterized protein LOC125055359 isoform X1 n=1 Tax=Pieris napi TaxID=78633 RepID=UPI001FBABCAF|nr:uncharacterized protein LOC125055359 isoform X1 [Pieris napi]
MACEVCEHCNSSINGRAAIYQGCSYHDKCRKCYVCSETDLHGAEVFRGVIFCSSCSKRIFQGCYSARKSKNKPRRKSRHIKTRRHENVIEIARRHINESRSDSDYEEYSKSTKTIPQQNVQNKQKNMKKNSAEMGTTTDVTQELLKQMHYPTLEKEEQAATSVKPKKSKNKERNRNKRICSDLRIAELGTSTEIAHMALRQRSAVPIIIKSETRMKRSDSKSLCLLERDSDPTITESDYSSKNLQNIRWLDRRFGSILKIPYIYFRKNILDRSSLVSMLMSSDRKSSRLFTKLKTVFNEEITRHQKRGLKKLFSTINRKKIPYKLGWLPVKNACQRKPRYRCKHYKKSHSYRCMRAQAMRLAGPTASELGAYRSKMKKVLPNNALKRVVSYNRHYETMLMMQAGNLNPHKN